MRSIKRIDRICKKLAKLWRCYPDERFGQFIVNHIFIDGKDPFFKEDVTESWMKPDYETWEKVIDNQIEKHKLWERVMKETNCKKDFDNYFKKHLKWMEENPMKWSQEKGEVVFVKKPKTPEPIAPKWEDYIKELKN